MRDDAGGVERAERAEQRRRRAGVADRGVRPRPTRCARAPIRLATAAPRRPSGSGSDHARTSNAASCSRDLAHDRQEDLFAEEAGVVEVAGRRSRRRRGSGRGAGCVRVTRAVIDGVAALGARARRAAAPAPQRASKPVPEAGDERVGGDDERDPGRARRRSRRPRRAAPPCPRAASRRSSAPPEWRREAERGGEDGVARALGERRAGRAPPQAVDDVVLEARRRRAPGRRPRPRG